MKYGGREGEKKWRIRRKIDGNGGKKRGEKEEKKKEVECFVERADRSTKNDRTVREKDKKKKSVNQKGGRRQAAER